MIAGCLLIFILQHRTTVIRTSPDMVFNRTAPRFQMHAGENLALFIAVFSLSYALLPVSIFSEFHRFAQILYGSIHRFEENAVRETQPITPLLTAELSRNEMLQKASLSVSKAPTLNFNVCD